VILAHGGAASTGGPEAFLPAVVLGLTAAAAGSYAVLARRQARRHGSWSGWRTVSFVTGAGLLGMALVPALSPFPAGDFRGHMLQHLLIGMYAPLLLVMGAPATLLLRTLPPRHGRVLGRLLHVAPLRVVTHPVTALVLNLGGLLVLYLTPLYVATTQRPVLHHLVHLHFLVAGYLFAHAIAGPDPAPRRPSVTARLVVLGVAVTGHAVLSQLLYAGALVQVPVSAVELRGAGELMYYGGDIAELLLALAMLTTWRRPRAAGRRHLAAGRQATAQW